MILEPFRMTPPYDVLLHGSQEMPVGLYHLQIATAEQLTRLHYSPGSVKAIKARLKVLTEQGYTQVDSIPVRQLRSPYFYTLGAKGFQYLKDAGFDTDEAWRAVKEVGKHALFIEHTLELNDVLISAALLQRVSSFRLDHFEHERALKRRPYHASWQTERGRQTATVIPDAFLDFRYEGRRMPVLLEHDRGTEEQFYFRRRIRAYIMLIRTEAYKELFGAKAITVAFTTFVGEHRLEQMRAWARAELASEASTIGTAFCFANLTPPLDPSAVWLAPIWYSAYDTNRTSLLAA